jgi:hypothetical protein
MSEPLDADQIEKLPLDSRQTLDCPPYTAGIRGEAGAATVARGCNTCFRSPRGKGPLIQAAGQVIELPTHVLRGQGEELAHGPGADRPHGREQPGDQVTDRGNLRMHHTHGII